MSDSVSLSSSASGTTHVDAHGNFFSDFRAINGKLKKRFLRRPNVAEATEQFAKLSRRIRDEDAPELEALCQLSVARCEQSVGHTAQEAEALIQASRSFVQAESSVNDMGCESYEEHLMAAVHSYTHAIRALEESKQPIRAAALCTEIANGLVRFKRTNEARGFYQKAAELSIGSVLAYCDAREKVADCYLEEGDYQNALVALADIANKIEQDVGKPATSIYADFLRRCEILHVLLLLLIEPTSQNISPSLTTILEKYTWESAEEDSSLAQEAKRYLSEELFLLLQSIVMAVQIRDTQALMELEDYLSPLISSQPRTLLRRLVRNMREKSPANI